MVYVRIIPIAIKVDIGFDFIIVQKGAATGALTFGPMKAVNRALLGRVGLGCLPRINTCFPPGTNTGGVFFGVKKQPFLAENRDENWGIFI